MALKLGDVQRYLRHLEHTLENGDTPEDFPGLWSHDERARLQDLCRQALGLVNEMGTLQGMNSLPDEPILSISEIYSTQTDSLLAFSIGGPLQTKLATVFPTLAGLNREQDSRWRLELRTHPPREMHQLIHADLLRIVASPSWAHILELATWGQLVQLPWLFDSDAGDLHNVAQHQFRSIQPGLPPQQHTDDYHHWLAGVLAGQGLGLMFEEEARPYLEQGQLIQWHWGAIEASLYLLYDNEQENHLGTALAQVASCFATPCPMAIPPNAEGK